jgi:transposase-like protein
MIDLKMAIETSSDLAISSDAGKGLVVVIVRVFPKSEHRECMRHLMMNFKKKFQGDVFTTHMWLAAKACTVEKCEYHLGVVKEASTNAIDFVKNNHRRMWCRSKFSHLIKCDYVNNNISESFNVEIKEFKGLHIVDLVDQIRQLIMMKFDIRRTVGNRLQGVIIPKCAQTIECN